MAMMASMEDELRCPVTLEVLQDPVMCMACQQSFSRHAVRLERSCPCCRAEPLEIAPNRLAARLLAREEQARALQQGYAQRRDGMQFAYTRPFTIFVTGMFGAGKSTFINLMVDPTGDTDVAVEDQTAEGVTQTVHEAFNGHIEHRGSTVNAIFVDTPGFGDPDRPDAETLKQLSEATVQMAAGMDSIVHVVKMGRMQEADRQLPQLLLAGLAPDAETRAELVKRWIFVVTHADSGRRPCDAATLERFKGKMDSFFPPELHDAVNRTERYLWSTGGQVRPTEMLQPIATRFWITW
ncbi:unnamed protein product [Symbiodinium sp. CCMP2456]|nr:unnamed protein product [Symbiodinium sp. CCMP2456]